MSIFVILVNHYTSRKDPNLAALKLLFNDSFYHVHILRPNANDSEEEIYLKCLRLARQQSLPTLIIKDNSICHFSVTQLQARLKTALNTDADCFYLCSWQDACHRLKPIGDNIYFLTHNKVAGATQAILFKPRVIPLLYKQLKNKCVISEALINISNNVRSVVFLPNLIEFDVRLATATSDYLKLNRCLLLEEDTEESNMNTVWIFLIIVLIILLALLVPYFKDC